MKSISDEKLISLFQSGNVDAFEEIYTRYSSPLVNFMVRMLHDQSRAEDIFQDIFTKLLERPTIYQKKARFKIWLYRVAVNRCLNEIRNRKKRQFKQQHELDTFEINQQCDNNQLSQIESTIEIQEAIERLPSEQQTVLLLKYYQKLTYPEISQIIKCPVGTIKSRMHYSIQNLRKLLLQD